MDAVGRASMPLVQEQENKAMTTSKAAVRTFTEVESLQDDGARIRAEFTRLHDETIRLLREDASQVSIERVMADPRKYPARNSAKGMRDAFVKVEEMFRACSTSPRCPVQLLDTLHIIESVVGDAVARSDKAKSDAIRIAWYIGTASASYAMLDAYLDTHAVVLDPEELQTLTSIAEVLAAIKEG